MRLIVPQSHFFCKSFCLCSFLQFFGTAFFRYQANALTRQSKNSGASERIESSSGFSCSHMITCTPPCEHQRKKYRCILDQFDMKTSTLPIPECQNCAAVQKFATRTASKNTSAARIIAAKCRRMLLCTAVVHLRQKIVRFHRIFSSPTVSRIYCACFVHHA